VGCPRPGPGVRITDIGRPRPSTARWILLVSPPRIVRGLPRRRRALRPTRWCSPLFPGPGRMLVGPHGAGIDAEGPLHVPDGVVFDDHVVQDALPGAVRGPDPQAFMRGLPGSVAFGQVSPGGAGAQLPQDRVDHLPVIAPPTASPCDRGQQRLDPRPGLVRQLTPTHHPRMITDSRSEPLQDTP
jgi:hypothetical protein